MAGGGYHLLTKAAQVLGSPAAPEIIRGQAEKEQDDSNREIAKLRILRDLAFWAWLIEGDGGGAVCRWMKALGVRCGRLLGPRKEAYFGRLRFRIYTR